MKKRISVMLVVLTLLLCGCGGKTSETVSMYDLRQAMEAADSSLPEMLNASNNDKDAEDLFVNISDMDYDKVDSYFVSYSKEGKADEIAVIAVRDEADIEEAKKSLQAHKEDRYKLLNQYEPEEVKRIEDGVIFSSGRYTVLIICDDTESVRKAFEETVK